MNVALWIVAGLLAVVFTLAGYNKLFTPKEKLAAAPNADWVHDFSGGALKAIGGVEILGVIGLILPAVLNIAPVLVPLAAVGLALVMVGAVIMRLRRGERMGIAPNLVYFAMAAFVAWGRFGPESFA